VATIALARGNLSTTAPATSTSSTAVVASPPTAVADIPDSGGGIGLGSWSGADALVTPPAGPDQQSAGVLSVTASAPDDMRVAAVSGSQPGSLTPASPNNVYTFSASVSAAKTPRPAEAVIGFLSASGSTIGSAWGQLASDPARSWTQTSPAVGIAPAGTSYLKFGVFFYGPDRGETHLVKKPSLSSHSSGAADLAGPLHTSGRSIYDAANQPVTLRGTVSEWLDTNNSAPMGSPLDDSNIAQMKQWGANTVRLLLSENSWSPTECGYSPSYASTVDQVVHSITSRGMVALLSLHSNGRTSCEKSVQRRMADAPGSIRFWTSVANRYKDNPLVAFDLYNEPHDISWNQWLNGGTLTDSDGVTWHAAGMRQMYEAVRSTGAGNIVFVSGNNWANTAPPPSDQLVGPNVAYAVHAYTCPANPPPACTAAEPYQAPSNLAGWSSFANSRPVMVTEFGWPDPGSGTYNQNVINWAKAHDVGWTAYAWSPGGSFGPTAPEFGLVADRATGEPEASGMPILAALSPNR
jgi:hypothetical protein